MQIIKKYANRKLYHTNQKKYITLAGIAKLIQEGDSVQVLDNETGGDITSTILAQAALQSRERSGMRMPATLLTGIIQLGDNTLANVRKAIFGSLGGPDLIEAEIRRRLDALLELGELNQDEHTHLRELLLRSEFAQTADHQIVGHAANLPSRSDIVSLQAQIDQLTATVEQLIAKQSK